jgi:hypothetical protein
MGDLLRAPSSKKGHRFKDYSRNPPRYHVEMCSEKLSFRVTDFDSGANELLIGVIFTQPKPGR